MIDSKEYNNLIDTVLSAQKISGNSVSVNSNTAGIIISRTDETPHKGSFAYEGMAWKAFATAVDSEGNIITSGGYGVGVPGSNEGVIKHTPSLRELWVVDPLDLIDTIILHIDADQTASSDDAIYGSGEGVAGALSTNTNLLALTTDGAEKWHVTSPFSVSPEWNRFYRPVSVDDGGTSGSIYVGLRWSSQGIGPWPPRSFYAIEKRNKSNGAKTADLFQTTGITDSVIFTPLALKYDNGFLYMCTQEVWVAAWEQNLYKVNASTGALVSTYPIAAGGGATDFCALDTDDDYVYITTTDDFTVRKIDKATLSLQWSKDIEGDTGWTEGSGIPVYPIADGNGSVYVEWDGIHNATGWVLYTVFDSSGNNTNAFVVGLGGGNLGRTPRYFNNRIIAGSLDTVSNSFVRI